MIAVLVISGSMGSGKTTVLAEASDLLTAAGIAHAAIDLDALGMYHLPDADDLALRNFEAVWRVYAAAGIPRLLIAEAIANVDRMRQAIPDAEIVVCRLRASIETMQQRVRAREPGMLQESLVARVAELEASLGPGDFDVGNEDRSVTDVAREMLRRAGWL